MMTGFPRVLISRNQMFRNVRQIPSQSCTISCQPIRRRLAYSNLLAENAFLYPEGGRYAAKYYFAQVLDQSISFVVAFSSTVRLYHLPLWNDSVISVDDIWFAFTDMTQLPPIRCLSSNVDRPSTQRKCVR
jgi:hypothetical protein